MACHLAAAHLQASIAFLHQNNVVHADLKPDNILFTTPQGEFIVGGHARLCLHALVVFLVGCSVAGDL